AILQCQVREILHAAMPGYAECFCHLWDDSPAPLLFARHTTAAEAVRRAGVAGLQQLADQAGLRCRQDAFHKVLASAEPAPPERPLRRRGNRRLRAALMQAADNLVQCNHYFRARAAQWARAGKDPRWVRVKVAKIFSRLAFALVAGRQLFPHPCCQPRHYVLGKLLAFHSEHGTDPQALRQDLEAAVEQLPAQARAAEAEPLQRELDALARRSEERRVG